MNYQQAAIVATDFELRAVSGGRPKFTGYASLFETPSEGLPYTEVIAAGAFKRALKAPNNYALVIDHNDRQQVATVKAGNLRLVEDSRGLLSEADLPDTTPARDLIGYYEAGMVRGMSFTFKPERTEKGPNGEQRRAEVKLGHVTALVSMDPVYADTGPTVQVRALADELKAEADDLDGLLDGIREGRALTDTEASLLDRLAAHFRPVPETPEGRSLDEWKGILAGKGIEVRAMPTMDMPDTQDAMCAHCCDATDGHGMDMPTDTPMAELVTRHRLAHQDGANHTHATD